MMMKQIGILVAILVSATFCHAQRVVGPWNPIFKGVDYAVGTNNPVDGNTVLQSVQVLRLDLSDPDLKLFTDPPCTNCGGANMTRGNTTSGFVEAYKLQGAINYSFFAECCSGRPGDAMHPFGLSISQGQLVTPNGYGSPSSGRYFYSVLQVTTNNVATIIPSNNPPASLDGVYTAIAGDLWLLTNGVVTTQNTDRDPRTCVGLSQDKRYLILLVIDGRRYGFSMGASYIEAAQWLRSFGAWDAIIVDGGGSSTMSMEDAGCPGRAVQVNKPISDGNPSKTTERVVASHLGFYALPLPGFINDVAAVPDSTSAAISWTTMAESTSQVEYGLTPSYDRITTLDSTMVTSHTVLLTGLAPTNTYYYRVISRVGDLEYSFNSCFKTTNLGSVTYSSFFDVTNTWKYSYANLDGFAWQAKDYADGTWPSGPGLLWVDTSTSGNNNVQPKNTQMPADPGTTYPYYTYYFRTHFTNSLSTDGMTLTFSNFVDDGAIFYLNGQEIYRLHMLPAPQVYQNTSLAAGYSCSNTSCSGSACYTCPEIFTLSGTQLASMIQGDNVLAVEVHNYNTRSPDITFGSALYYTVPKPKPPPPFINSVTVVPGETSATISWVTISNSSSQVFYGLTDQLGSSSPLVSTPITNHVVVLTNLAPLTKYYFKVASKWGTNLFSDSGIFTTVEYYQPLMSLTNTWRWTTNNLDGLAWQLPAYNDAGWLGQGPALLVVEDNVEVNPKNTYLPGIVDALPPTYYFRSKLVVTNNPAGFALLFSNYVDDGAVFYLNGTEVYRLRMPSAPQPVNYFTLATDFPDPITHDATSPDLFRLGGDVMTNLLVGTNILAAEVHQVGTTSSDIVFGSAVGFVRQTVNETRVRCTLNHKVVCLSWAGVGFTLQQSLDVNNTLSWTDVPGPIKTSPYCVTNPPGPLFYRLRQ